VVPRSGLMDGIDKTRALIPKIWFDEDKAIKGIEALRSYHKVWDDKKKIFGDKPHHDWSSNGADALRTGAMYKVDDFGGWEDVKYPTNMAIV